MFGTKFVAVIFTISFVVVESKHLQDVDGIPQKEVFLIKEFKSDQDVIRQDRRVHGMDNEPAISMLMNGETTNTKDEDMEVEDLKRYRRGVKKSSKKGGGGGKGGCKKGRK